MRWLAVLLIAIAAGAAFAREQVWGSGGSGCVWGTRGCSVTASGITGVAGSAGLSEWDLMIWDVDDWG